MRDWWFIDPCVYIMASKRDGILYVGVTSCLFDRVSIHKQDLYEGFTKKHGVHRLVYYEKHPALDDAFLRETRMKKWKRAWKVRLVQEMNPEWIDLFDEKTSTILDGPADIARRKS
jgi:putative endonuclease